MAEFLSSAAFAKAAHDGAVPLDTTVAKQFQADAHADDATRTVKFTITTGDVDRENDVVNPRGWEVAEYMKSPVVLWAHDYKALPIAKALDITAVGNGLVSTAQFPEKGIHPFADTVFELIKGGFIKAASVGFRPIDWAYNETRKGVDHKKQSLIEWSCVPVPANPSALVSARAAGIDVSVLKGWAEETLTAFKTLPELTPVEKAEAAAQARDEVGWKAYTKALARAQKKSGETPVTLAARAEIGRAHV